MYCYRCGVKLPDGENICPLCGTVLPAEKAEGNVPLTYSEKYPKEQTHVKYLALALATAILAAACIICFIICIATYRKVFWSGYVMLGIALFYIWTILPFWFPKRNPLVFLPIDFAALCGYLLYICLYTGGRWFLSFAFPLVGIVCFLTITAVALCRKLKKGRLFVTSGVLIGIGCSTMLIEFFEHITFHTPMFLWSLYCVCLFSAIGIFLLIAGCVPPLRETLNRKFFL